MLPDRTDRQTGRERKFQFPIAVQQSYVYWKSAWRQTDRIESRAKFRYRKYIYNRICTWRNQTDGCPKSTSGLKSINLI